jgi:hypothetical protein
MTNSSSAGFRRPALKCKKCGRPFPLTGRTEKLPDPFPAKCPACRQEGTYAKSDIQELMSVGH